LDATNKGFSVGEVMWQAKDGEYSVLDVQAKNQRRFTFDEDANLKLLTSAAPYKGEPLPQRKFIVHSVGSKDGSPYGLGLGNKLFWPVLFKRQDITFWLTFADKYGSPTAVGTYPRGSSEDDQNKLLGVLRTIAHDTGIIIPEGMMIDLLEAKRSGATDVYEPLARYMDEQISECVLGETMSTTAQGAGLGSGQANVHNEVRVEAAVDDDYLLNATINGSLVRWIVDLNMPGAGYPTFKRDFAEPEDLEKRAKRDQALRQMGADFTPEYITKTYGEGVIWQQGQPPPSATALPPIDEGADPAFAETLRHTAAGARADQLVLQQAAEKLAGRRRLLQQRVDDLHTLLEETGDLVKFREGLVELLRGEPPAEVTESLSRAGFSAQMLGRTRQR
jgi:phage gp29-like protein